MQQVFLSVDKATFDSEEACAEHEAGLFGAWIERVKNPGTGRPPSGVSTKLTDVLKFAEEACTDSDLLTVLEAYFKHAVANPPAPKPRKPRKKKNNDVQTEGAEPATDVS